MTTDAACNTRLLATLEREGWITATNRLVLDRFIATWEVSAFHALIMTGLLSEADWADALAGAMNLRRYRSFSGAKLAPAALSILNFRWARDHECLPLIGPEDSLVIVFADPSRDGWISEIKQGLKAEFTLAVGERSDIVKAIDELYPLAAQLPSLYGG